MEVFIFIGGGGYCGATTDPSGVKLPHVTGPWSYLKKTRLGQVTGINLLTALREIKTKGYYLIMPDNLSGPCGKP
jgi:hypothetical protein